MSIGNADKIFVNVDDEINFVVEKILSSEKDRVIVVVPQNALMVSSLVSMKIMSKQVTKSKKNVVIVTEDEFGLKLAKQSGLVSTAKVSNVTPEMWESTQIAKEKAKEEMEVRKKTLLTDRGILEPESKQSGVGGPGSSAESSEPGMPDVASAQAGNPEMEGADVIGEIPDQVREAMPTGRQAGENTTSDVESAGSQEVVDKPRAERVSLQVTGNGSQVTGSNAVQTPEVEGAIKRTRREAKMVEVAGFKVYAGGDINEAQSTTMEDNTTNEVEDRVEKVKKIQKDRDVTGFTGKDWTSHTGNPKPRMQMPKLFGNKPRSLTPDAAAPANWKEFLIRHKKPLMIGGGVLLALLIGAFVVVTQLSSVDIQIQLKTAEVPIEQQITADTAVTEVDETNLIVPALVVSEVDLSISATDNSSGEGSSGNKAAGVIEIWNFTAADVTVAAGTVAQNTTTNLNYIIKKDVVVPAGSANGAITDPGIVKDVPVEAEKFGTDYNMTEIGSKIDFKIGASSTDDLEGKRFNRFEGGTTETFKAPSQEDIDRVKVKLVEDLERQSLTKIKSKVPVGYRLVEGTSKFEETETRSTPEIGQKGDTFSLTVEGKVTALAISEDHLAEAITILIERNEDSDLEGEFEVSDLGNAEITNVTRDADKATFTIVSRGSLQSKVTEDELKDSIKGKTLPEAEDTLLEVEQIESVKISFSPGFLPSFLQRVPGENNKISIVFN